MNTTKAILLCAAMAAGAATAAETNETAAALAAGGTETNVAAAAEAASETNWVAIAETFAERLAGAEAGNAGEVAARRDITLRWFMFGGFVFTSPFCYLGFEKLGAGQPVLVLYALPDDCMEEYTDIDSDQVISVNGTRVRNLRHLAQLVDDCRDGSFLLGLSGSDDRELVIDAKKLREATPRIMERFQIPADRSEDLLFPRIDTDEALRETMTQEALDRTKEAAEQGDAKAMLVVATLHATGVGAEKNETEALDWYEKSLDKYKAIVMQAPRMETESLRAIGRKLVDGKILDSVEPSVRNNLGMGFMLIAARRGNPDAMRDLGEQLAKGTAGEGHEEVAVHWLRKAAERGDERAHKMLNDCLFSVWRRMFGELVEKAVAGDPDSKRLVGEIAALLEKGRSGDEVSILNAMALVGYAPYQAELGRYYMTGDGVPQDMRKGVEWLKKAADQGEYRAQFWLGQAYERGEGVEKDDCRAMYLWRQAQAADYSEAVAKMRGLPHEYGERAEEGDSSAQFLMGIAFEFGCGEKQDFEKAVEWYLKAADQGHPGAQGQLGCAFGSGQGVAQNAAEAARWFRKAAEQGNPWAQQNYGQCLFEGSGVEKDERAAVAWAQKAAERGVYDALFDLGFYHWKGTDVKDIKKAVSFFQRAAVVGDERAAAALAALKTTEGVSADGKGRLGNSASVWERRFDSLGDPVEAPPVDAKILDRFAAGAGTVALVVGKTDKDEVFNRDNHLEGDPTRNSLFLSRTDEAGRTQWRLLLTSGSSWTPAGTWKDWQESEVRDCFEVVGARFSSDGKRILLVLNPHTNTYSLVCILDLETSVLRCLGDGCECSEEKDGTILVKGRKTYLTDENGNSLGARWYDEWMTPDGKSVRKGPLNQSLD